MGERAIRYEASRVHAHRWPADSPEWDGPARSLIGSVCGRGPRRVEILGGTVRVGGAEFTGAAGIGVSVPPARRECTLTFGGRFGRFSAHVHVTAESGDYAGIFGMLASWRDAREGPGAPGAGGG